MNAVRVEPRRWSRRQWFYTLAVTLTAQVALLFYFGGRPRPAPPPPHFTADIYSAVDPWSAQQLARLPTLSDPALFALPRPQGFSVSAWLSFPPPEHRLTDWKESAHWLALNPMWLGDSFAALAATSVIEPMLIAEKPLPRPTGLDVPIPNEPLATVSELRIEGELAHRSLLAPLDLPGFSSPEPLTNTIVQLLVDAAGRPLTATLLVESGSMLVERGSKDAANEADQHAMRQATAARFEPLRRPNGMPQPDPRLSWGKLVFQWATWPPTATNSAAAQP